MDENDKIVALRECSEFVSSNLVDICSELLSVADTGELKDGFVRKAASLLGPLQLNDANQRIAIVQSLAQEAAFEFVVASFPLHSRSN